MRQVLKRVLSLLIIFSMTSNLVLAAGIEAVVVNEDTGLGQELLGENDPVDHGEGQNPGQVLGGNLDGGKNPESQETAGEETQDLDLESKEAEASKEDEVTKEDEVIEENTGKNIDKNIDEMDPDEAGDQEDLVGIEGLKANLVPTSEIESEIIEIKISESEDSVLSIINEAILIANGELTINVIIDKNWELLIQQEINFNTDKPININFIGEKEKEDKWQIGPKDTYPKFDSRYGDNLFKFVASSHKDNINVSFKDINFYRKNKGTTTIIEGKNINLNLESVEVDKFTREHNQRAAAFKLEDSTVVIGGNSSFKNNENKQGVFNLKDSLLKFDGESITFSKNKSNLGGALYLDNTSVAVHGGNLNFKENIANKMGGAIYIKSSDDESVTAHITIFGGNTHFEKNESLEYGGAIGVEGKFIIRGESTNSGKVLFDENKAVSKGGAINIQDKKPKGNATLRKGEADIELGVDIEFRNNKSENSTGGAIYSEGNFNMISSKDISFYNNQARSEGGGIYSPEFIALKGKNIIFQKNISLDQSGAGLYSHSQKLSENIIKLEASEDIKLQENEGKNGGAIHAWGNILLASKNLNLVGNKSVIGAAGITSHGVASGGVQHGSLVKVSVGEKMSFNKNTTDGAGGVFSTQSLKLDGELIEFYENKATLAGGAINANGEVILNGKKIILENNTSSKGGAIYSLSLSNLSIKGEEVIFSNNSSQEGGGVIWAQGRVNIEADNLKVDGNKGENGGAIKSRNSSVNIKSKSGIFSNNIATGDGGAIYALTGITLDGEDMDFYNNKADQNGGAINLNINNLDHILTINQKTKLSFIGNKAARGAAISAKNIVNLIENDYYKPEIFGELLVLYNGEKAVINDSSIIPNMSGKLIIDANGGKFGEDKEKLEYSIGVKPQLSIGELLSLTGPGGVGPENLEKIIISHDGEELEGPELKTIDDLNNYLNNYRLVNEIKGFDLDNLSPENIEKIKEVFSNNHIEQLLKLREIKATLVWKEIDPIDPIEPAPEFYQVNLNANGGNFIDGSDDMNIVVQANTGINPASLEEPFRSNYRFSGWFRKVVGEEIDFDLNTPINEDISLYARWVERVTVTLNANGGTFEDGEGIQIIELDKDGLVDQNHILSISKPGFIYSGWLIRVDGEDIGFDLTTPITENITLYAQWDSNETVLPPADKVTVSLDANGGSFADGGSTRDLAVDKDSKLAQASLEKPTRSGYDFTGWIKSGETSNFDFETNIEAAFTLVAQWTRESTSGGGGGGGGGGGDRDPKPKPEDKPKEPVIKEDKPSSGRDRKDRIIGEVIEPMIEFELNMVDHLAYLKGYKDNTIKPTGTLTREEAAMVFYRIMDGEFREGVRTSEHSFTDVEKGRWSEVAIASLAKAGMITGYEDGSYQPRKPITRAELASLIGKLTDTIVLETEFEDILEHWAEDSINSVQQKGWIKGYKDGSFKPNDLLSRSEFATIINSILERKVEKAEILDGIKTFKDLEKDKWYYEIMVEAINGHSYIIEDGREIWTELDHREFE